MAVAFPATMRNLPVVVLGLALAAATPLHAQSDSSRPSRGKIDGVERDKKRSGSGHGSDEDCDCGGVWFFLRATGDLLSAIAVPHGPGRGYEAFPYAETDRAHPFVIPRTEHGRYFATVSAQYFNDATSTLAGGQFKLEGASALWYGGLEYNHYVEPLATETDHLHTWRAGIGLLPHLGHSTMLRIGGAARGIVLDDGSSSAGPEFEIGVLAFPRRPFGASATGRISAQSWGGGGTFAFRELNTTGSIFLGRVEVEVGWHWAKIGSAPAFGGPTIGTRLWF